MTSRFRSILPGVVIACVFTLLLNAADLRSWSRGTLTVAELGATLGSADEVYYFALIRDARDGHLNMGNSSFMEYSDAPSLTGYALLPQGLLARFTSLELPTVILVGDVVFPALVALALYLVAFAFFRKRTEAGLFTAFFLLRWGAGLLRPMNPQVTMAVLFLCLFFFLIDPDVRRPWRRGIALALAVLTHPVCALLLLSLEGLDLLVAMARRRAIVPPLRERIGVFLPPVVAGVTQSVWVSLHTDASILADLSARRGLILSHFPSDPVMSVILLVLAALWLFTSRRGAHSPRSALLALAGIIVLNQQVVHGHEAIFGLYYRTPLTLIVALMSFGLLGRVVTRPVLIAALAFTVITYAPGFVTSMQGYAATMAEASLAERNSDIPAVLSALEEMPGQRVVLAPIEVSNLVPVFTRHTTLFTQYAHFEYVSDRELGERYTLLRHFFELPAIQTVEGDPLVFGLAAGNLYARAKTACGMKHLLGFTAQDCTALRLPDFIRHQDVRVLVDTRAIEPSALLRTYAVDTVISDRPLVPLIASRCRAEKTVGRYTIYGCRFAG